jgi:hypothetical protein
VVALARFLRNLRPRLYDDEVRAAGERVVSQTSAVGLGVGGGSRLLRSPRIVGADVTIFDPTLDPDGTLARRLVALLRSALAAS